MTRRDRLEKQMYKAIAKGNFAKAEKIRSRIVDIDVAGLRKYYRKNI